MRVTILRALDLWFRDSRQPRPMTAEELTRHEPKKASASMVGYLDEVSSRAIDVLHFGCGRGDQTIRLASEVRSVVGVDADQSSIAQARRALRAADLDNCRFAAITGGSVPLPDSSIDAVFSADTFEHVIELDLAFREIARVLRPGGILVTRFGPLFYSPYGYQMQWVCQVPYAHLIFGLDAIMALRRERTGQLLDVQTWQDTGLNGRRYREFKAAALAAGLSLDRFKPVPVRRLAVLARLPLLRDLFIFGVDCVARKPGGEAGA